MNKILIVDDDEMLCVGLAELLESEGYDVSYLHSGIDVLSSVKEDDFDVVFLDLRLPGKDGLEVLKELKAYKPELNTIVMTAFATVPTAVEALKLGAFDYIRKPFELDEVLSNIAGIMEDIKLSKTELQDDRSGTELFRESIMHSDFALWVTGYPTEEDKKRFPDKVKILQLSERRDELAVSPKDLESLALKIKELTEGHNNPSILIDMDILLEKNEPEDVVDLILDQWKNLGEILTIIISGSLKDDFQKELDAKMYDSYFNSVVGTISHPIRRDAVLFLQDEKGAGFIRILKKLGLKDTPKLGYHLKWLRDENIIAQDQDKKYSLTILGAHIADMLNSLRKGWYRPPKIHICNP